MTIQIPLKKGDKGSDVLAVQKFLNSIQGATHPIAEDSDFGTATHPIGEDSIFETATESLVKNFQQRENLLADGIVGVKTLEAMRRQGF